MFEIRKQGKHAMNLVIGTWVDVFEFAKRWNALPRVEKEIVRFLDDNDVGLDIDSLQESLAKDGADVEHCTRFEFRLALEHLKGLGLIEYHTEKREYFGADTDMYYTKAVDMEDFLVKLLDI